MRRVLQQIASLLVVAIALSSPTAAASAAETTAPVKVMSRNVYFGTSLTRASQAQTPDQFLAAVSTIFSNFQATDFEARAKVLAREIKDADPELIGLQEVALWRQGPVGTLDGPATPAQDVVLDFLPVLQRELARQGVRYDLVKEQPELDLEGPAGSPYFRDIRLTSRDVILAKRGTVEVRGSSSGNFASAATVPSVLGPLTVKAAWASADVMVSKHSFRFVSTHLEPNDPSVRADQAAELVREDGPAPPSHDPVVLVGDLNADPASPDPEGAAFRLLAASGLSDTWRQANGSAPGYTYGFSELLNDADTKGFTTRIDHVLTRGAVAPASKARLIGLDADARTPSGIWPSDHAGLVTTVYP